MSLVKKKRTTVSNKDAWESADVVEDYVLDTTLQPPEESILNLLRDQISDMKMLDIGVGAGRTTRHFAELVREYVGIDYSERMISKCNEYLSGFGGNSSFFVNDVRSLEKFRDDEFDFILFSFNGLDNIAHDERLRVLQEISRIGKPGSFFCFSTHNLQYIDHIFDLLHQLTWKPRTMLNRLKRWFAVTFVHNNPLHILSIKNNQYGIFNDGAFAYSLQQYYITPSQQIKQLKKHFENIRLFLLDGSEAKDNTNLEDVDDWWIYYLCNVKT